MDEDGRAAVLERWREHLDILAIKGVWCAQRDLPQVLHDVRGIARQHGFGRIMSPLISRDDAGPYRAEGMEAIETIVALRSNLRSPAPSSSQEPASFDILLGTQADAGDLLHVDTACFPSFWKYGPASIASILADGRVAMATESDQVIGYTWCTIDRGIGTLGRLAVLPEARGRGIGGALLADALGFMARNGADAASLCTQEDNSVSRALYDRAGFRELPGRLVFLGQEA